jgi:hypothetical protein
MGPPDSQPMHTFKRWLSRHNYDIVVTSDYATFFALMSIYGIQHHAFVVEMQLRSELFNHS